MFRPECLVESKDVSTFYLFSILVAGGILFVFNIVQTIRGKVAGEPVAAGHRLAPAE